MRILYKDEDGYLATAEIYMIAYDPRTKVLFFEEESVIREITAEIYQAEHIIQTIYRDGKADASILGRAMPITE